MNKLTGALESALCTCVAINEIAEFLVLAPALDGNFYSPRPLIKHEWVLYESRHTDTGSAAVDKPVATHGTVGSIGTGNILWQRAESANKFRLQG